MKILLLALFLTSILSYGQTKAKEGSNEMKSLKKILTNDFLEEEFKKKKAMSSEEDQAREQRRLMTLRFPTKKDYWKVLSEIWLVKNAAILKWDIKTPEYGLEENISKLFKALGVYEKKFKILLVDSPSVPHIYLPMEDEILYILSVPFLRALDLTKLEISLMIFEDFMRSESKYVEKFIKIDHKKLRTGFISKKETKNILNKNLKEMSDFIFTKGYNFQAQFDLTKKMDQMLKPTPVYWKIYLDYLKKVDTLTKSSELYKSYNRLYPSPEMQIHWLIPKS